MGSPLQTRIDTHHFDGVAYSIRSLADRNQFHDPDGITEALGISSAGWPFFGMTWPAGLLLAELISHEPLGSGRILELGCGLGMASLVANMRGADILATDQHPMAGEFLDNNSLRNGLSITPFQCLDWRTVDPVLGLFDMIIGSDLLYEPNHPELLCGFLGRHSHAETRILIVDPKRRLHTQFRQRMEQAGFQSHSEAATPAHWVAFGFKGVIQRFDGYQPSIAQ